MPTQQEMMDKNIIKVYNLSLFFCKSISIFGSLFKSVINAKRPIKRNKNVVSGNNIDNVSLPIIINTEQSKTSISKYTYFKILKLNNALL